MAVAHDRKGKPHEGLARRMARTLAHSLRSELAGGRLWVWSQMGYIEPGRDYVELWIYADPTDPAAEQRLRHAGAGLHKTYPDANIRVHTVTPVMLSGHEVCEVIREGAEEIPLDAS